MFLRFFALALVALCSSVPVRPVTAATCGDEIPAAGNLGYRLRHNDQRCEGLHMERLSGGIELASLTLGRVNWRPRIDSELRIGAVGAAAGLTLLGSAIPPGGRYKLTALLKPQVPFRLPLREVIEPLGIQPDTLGLLARREQRLNGRDVFVPVFARTADQGATTGTSIVAAIRATQDIVDLRWRLVIPLAQGSAAAEWQRLPLRGPYVARGEFAEIVLPSWPSGVVAELHLLYRLRDGRELPASEYLAASN